MARILKAHRSIEKTNKKNPVWEKKGMFLEIYGEIAV